MVNIANTLRNKTEVTGLAPNQEEQRNVKQLAAEIRWVSPAREYHVRFQAEERAPRGVVVEELPPEPPEYAGVEGVHDGGGRIEAHLRVGEVENQMLPLVPRVVELEPEQ